jgi:hypothetical protein
MCRWSYVTQWALSTDEPKSFAFSDNGVVNMAFGKTPIGEGVDEGTDDIPGIIKVSEVNAEPSTIAPSASRMTLQMVMAPLLSPLFHCGFIDVTVETSVELVAALALEVELAFASAIAVALELALPLTLVLVLTLTSVDEVELDDATSTASPSARTMSAPNEIVMIALKRTAAFAKALLKFLFITKVLFIFRLFELLNYQKARKYFVNELLHLHVLYAICALTVTYLHSACNEYYEIVV